MDINEQYFDYLAETVVYGNRTKPRARYPRIWREFQPIERTKWTLNPYPGSDDDVNVWFSSDHHFGHKNIIRYSDRPYPNLDMMKECLILNHNNVVKENDIWICVGDFAFLPDAEANKILNRLNGYKILIIGNHDINKKKVKQLEFDAIYPCFATDVWDMTFFISHYPFEYVPPGVFNIHGHEHITHQTCTGLPFFNVNVELHNYKPVSLLSIVDKAKKRMGSFE